MTLKDDKIEIFKKLYGEKFNRFLTVGTKDKGYTTYHVTEVDELYNLYKEYFQKNDMFISLYDFDTKEDVSKWNFIDDSDKFNLNAIKDTLLIRLRQDTSVLFEETEDLNPIQAFTFLRRILVLGFDDLLFDETKKVYDFLNKEFSLEPLVYFDGINECFLIISLKDIQIENNLLVTYSFNRFLEDVLGLETLKNTSNIYSQLVSLPLSQNMQSRFYSKFFSPKSTYGEIFKSFETSDINYEFKDENPISEDFKKFLLECDKNVSKLIKSRINPSGDYDLNLLFDLDDYKK